MPKRKDINELVWPVENYYKKIEFAVKARMCQCHWLTFTEAQLAESIKKGYGWLQHNNKKQDDTLGVIIRITCRSLIQQGAAVSVEHPLNTKRTWQWRRGAESTESTSVITTGIETTVSSEKAKEYIKKYGPVGISKLSQLQRI